MATKVYKTSGSTNNFLLITRSAYIKVSETDGGQTHNLTISRMMYRNPVGDIWQNSTYEDFEKTVDDATASLVDIMIQADDTQFTAGNRIKEKVGKTILQIENITREELIELIGKGSKTHTEKGKNNQEEELMTSRELALFLDVTTQTLVRWRQQGIIPYYGSGKTIFHKKSEILEALKNNPQLNR